MRPSHVLQVALWLLSPLAVHAAPLDRPVEGPKRLCFKYSTFDLLPGETVVSFTGGMEGMSLSVDSPAGRYEVAESEIFASPKRLRGKVFSQGDTSVFRGAGRTRRYAIYGKTSYSDGKDRLVIWLSGPALTGGAGDAAIYRRFAVQDPRTVSCEMQFTYAWGF